MNIYYLLLTITLLALSTMMKTDCSLLAQTRDTPNSKRPPELTEFILKMQTIHQLEVNKRFID